MGRFRSSLGRWAIVGIVAVLVPLQGVASSSAASAATCTAYEFIGARGSGESPHDTTGTDADYDAESQYGMGDRVFDVYDVLSKKVESKIGSGQISAHGVRYPAQGIA